MRHIDKISNKFSDSYNKTYSTICLLLLFSVLMFSLTGCKPKTNIGSNLFSDSEDGMSQNGLNKSDSFNSDLLSDNSKTADNNDNSNNNQNNGSGGISSVNNGSNSLLNEKISNYINVKSFGAKGDGTTDDSVAIESAIQSINKTGGIIYLPTGTYRMAKGIVVPMGISILGEKPETSAKWHLIKQTSTAGATEASGPSWIAPSNFRGTWIFVDHGKGNVNSNPTFRLQGNTTIDSLGFVYPGQAPVMASVVEYPPAIAVITTISNKYSRDGITIANISLLNPYVGIAIMQNQDLKNDFIGSDDTQGGKISTGRMTVRNINGSPLWKGILIKGILDTIDLNQIQFGYSNFNSTFSNYRHDNCIDIEVARADGINIYNSFSLGSSYGIKTTTAFSGASSIRASKLTIKGRVPVSLVSGLYMFSDSEFTMMNYGNFCNNNTYVGIEINQDTRCIHQPFYLFNNLKVFNEITSTSLSDIGMSIRLGKSGNVAMSNSAFINSNPNNAEPVIMMQKNDGSVISAQFDNTSFTSNSSGLLAKIESIPTGSLQFNNCTISDNLYNNLPSGNSIWFSNSKLSSGSTINRR